MSTHADLPTLLAYWQGELGESEEAAFEEHYLGCALCSARLAEVEALSDGVRGAFANGHVATFVAPGFVEKLRSGGLRLREYVVPRNGSVNCSVAPEDQFLLSRLQVPLEGVERIDAIATYAGGHRFEDVPFDAASGEVVVVQSIEQVRAMPEHRQSVRLVSVGPGGDRLLGEYVFNHSPHR